MIPLRSYWQRHVGQRRTQTTMNADGSHHSGSRAAWRRTLLWSLRAALSLVVCGPAAGPSNVLAQGTDYRPATAAPAAWQEFAKQLQSRFQQWLAADDERARRLQDHLARQGDRTGALVLSLVVRSWIRSDGTVDRVEFDDIDDQKIAAGLQALLVAGNVGAPPPDMLQPLHLRLSLRPNEPQRQGQ
jgi:hypothetical protein